MAILRKAVTAGLALTAVLFAIPPTASASPTEASPAWTTETSAGSTITVVPSTSGRPGKELLFHTEGNGKAFVVLPLTYLPGNSLWARVRVKLGTLPFAPNWAHWTIAEASGADSSTLVRPLGGQFAPTDNGNFWGVGSDLGPTGDWTNWRTSAPAVADTWQCLEFHLDASDNKVTVYFDGVENPDLTVSTKSHGGTADDFTFPTFDKLKLGWQLYQGNPSPSSYDVRMSDIAVSPWRAGC